jgi:hypothetical protein
MRPSMLSWIVTVVAFALILGVIVAHGEPCSGSTAQQVTTIARVGAQPGLMVFFCGVRNGGRHLVACTHHPKR